MSSVPAFRDLTGFTAVLKSCLFAYSVLSLISVWSGWGVLQLLGRAIAGVEITEVDANNTRQALVGVLYVLAFIVTGLAFLRWIVLANRNARIGRQGASGCPPADWWAGTSSRSPRCGSRIRRWWSYSGHSIVRDLGSVSSEPRARACVKK